MLKKNPYMVYVFELPKIGIYFFSFSNFNLLNIS